MTSSDYAPLTGWELVLTQMAMEKQELRAQLAQLPKDGRERELLALARRLSPQAWDSLMLRAISLSMDEGDEGDEAKAAAQPSRPTEGAQVIPFPRKGGTQHER